MAIDASYGYPPEMRGVPDLFRRRRYYVDICAAAYRHIKMVFMQHGFIGKPIPILNKRKGREEILRDISQEKPCRLIPTGLEGYRLFRGKI